jgi:hypothetical protein
MYTFSFIQKVHILAQTMNDNKNMHNKIARQVNECLMKRLYVTVGMKKIHEPRFCITT